MIFIPAENNSEVDFSLPLHEVFRLAAARRDQMDEEIDTKNRLDVPPRQSPNPITRVLEK